MSAEDLIRQIAGLSPRAFMDHEAVRTQFIKKCMQVAAMNQPTAIQFYTEQALYLKRVLANSWNPDKPDNYLGNCTTFSLYSAFMDLTSYGEIISLNPDDKLAYIQADNVKTGFKENRAVYEKRAKLVISPYGELNIRIDAGQIKYADPVVVVYDGDIFEIGTDERMNTMVYWKSKVTGRPSKKIIGGFVKLTRPDGSFVTGYLLQEDVDRLAEYSGKRTKGKWYNPLYGRGEDGSTNIDAGFLKAKVLRHSFKTFSRVKLRGTNSVIDDMAEDVVDQELQGPPEDWKRPAFTGEDFEDPGAGSGEPWEEESLIGSGEEFPQSQPQQQQQRSTPQGPGKSVSFEPSDEIPGSF